MKNKVVKILATIGLIIAIVLILRGVFDVGKIGFKNLSSKTYIKFERCYAPGEYKNYEEHFLAEGRDAFYLQVYFEIDLKRNLATITEVRSEEALKKLKELHNVIASKIRIDTYPIVTSSKTYIGTDYMVPKSSSDVRTEYSYTFNLKEGYVEINARNVDTLKMRFTSIWQCENY